jgi:hypothetical protein
MRRREQRDEPEGDPRRGGPPIDGSHSPRLCRRGDRERGAEDRERLDREISGAACGPEVRAEEDVGQYGRELADERGL